MNLKKYHTLKCITHTLILLVLLGCETNPARVSQQIESQNNSSSNHGLSTEILSSKLSPDDYRFIEEIFRLREFSDQSLERLDKILALDNLYKRDRQTLTLLKNDLIKIKSDLNSNIEVTAPAELKEIFIKTIFSLPYKFELTFTNELQAEDFLKNNGIFCNSLEIDSIKTLAQALSNKDQNIVVITDNNKDSNLRFVELNPSHIFTYENQDPQIFAASILQITQSDERFKNIDKLAVPIKVQFVPRIRKDFDLLVFDMDHSAQKKLIPAFRYNYANKLQYYSTIKSLNSILKKGDFLDYEEVNFSAPNLFLNNPLILFEEEAILSAIISDWLTLSALKQKNLSTRIFNGSSGIFQSGRNCVERSLNLSKLKV